ncbi:ATP-NAD kinase [Halomarina litorea]|uniref:ATP-NAD kinase n=1 Tax=Halomarina litorea TaxID=2961595 RepID=UPI0020C3ADD2|nr:ATP-NAD kinase [Halomarina sp. BCD28]
MSDEGAGPRAAGAGRRGSTRLAIVGDDPIIAAAAADAGDVVDDPADAEAVVAVGESALLSLVPDGARPTLAVDVCGPLSFSRERAAAALSHLARGTLETVDQSVVAVEYPGGREHVLTDAMLVTAEPARISEYSVHHRGREVARFRADGCVVATPLGSHGYAAAAGGPSLAPTAGVAAVVPVAPFAIDTDRWVLPLPLSLCVERDEADVELLADDRRAGSIPAGEPVRLGRAGDLPLVDPRSVPTGPE